MSAFGATHPYLVVQFPAASSHHLQQQQLQQVPTDAATNSVKYLRNIDISSPCLQKIVFQLKALGHIRPALTDDMTVSIAVALIHSRLDYVNSACCGILYLLLISPSWNAFRTLLLVLLHTSSLNVPPARILVFLIYRVGQIKWHHFAFLLVTHECIHKILRFLAHINYIMQKMRWC